MASKPITKLGHITSAEERNALKAKGDKVGIVEVKSAGKQFALWFERGDASPITRIQFAFTNQMRSALAQAGYTEFPLSLNLSGSGNAVSAWYYCGNTDYDNPIVEMALSCTPEKEASLFYNGWEKVGCDFLRGNDLPVHVFLWVKRQTPSYICDIIASSTYENNKVLYEAGYTRIDETINQRPGGEDMFLWIRKSGDQNNALSFTDVSKDPHEYQQKVQSGYTRINTNFGSDTKEIYVWYARGSAIHLQNITVLVSDEEVEAFKKSEISVVSLGETGWPTFMAWK